MKLSVIIVNYNVRYFLSSCLQSVSKAIEGLDAEVFVVDNNSTDQSVEMLQSDYSWVKVIANDFNAGFSKANNQAIKISKGEFVILLNPDTIVEEDCFSKCLSYMDENKDVGGMGVKMIDGSGNFLPESKRGLPTPSVAFYKIFGLSKLFPKSKRFGAYHLGYLDDNETAEIEVLSGAFMLIRKEVIDKIGGLDESFFMYGEDIDMSYRITEAGYKNVYFPHAEIIHFKGESTKKSTVNYVLVFYRAMIIFAKKHFSHKNARLLSFLINMAIYLRAGVALISRFLERIYMPLFDFAFLWATLVGITAVYEQFIVQQENYLPQEVEIMAFPIIILCWIFGQFLLGGYHQPVKLKTIFKGLITSALIVFVLYAMLDESLRFSRVIVALSVVLNFLFIPLSRLFLSALSLFKLIRFTDMNSAIVGSTSEIERVKKILSESTERKKHLFYINPLRRSESNGGLSELKYSGSLHQLNDAIKLFDIDEVVFCLKDVSAHDAIQCMQQKLVKKSNIYLYPDNGNYILKSSSMNTIGEFILPESTPEMEKWSSLKKRLFDVSSSLILIVLSPLFMLFYRKPLQLLKNLINCFFGASTFIGYSDMIENKTFILDAWDPELTEEESGKKKIDYLMNYGTEKDLEILVSKLGYLDRIPR